MTGTDRDKSNSGASAFIWPELDNFSLVLGGPLYQFFRKTHLEDRIGREKTCLEIASIAAVDGDSRSHTSASCWSW